MFNLALAKLTSVYFGAAQCSHGFFFLPNWWEYLKPAPTAPNCAISFNFPGDIWLVGLAVLDALVRVAGFVAVISIVIAGIQLLVSEGNTEKGVAARSRIINSLVGLAIALVAATVVSFIGKTIGG